jgi:cytochrome c-type biogenesis protein CcmH/NrfG
LNARVISCASAAAILVSLGACTAPRSKTASLPAPAATISGAAAAAGSVEEFAAAVASDARRSDGERDAQVREQLAAHAQEQAQACLRRAPQAPACLYYQGVALGLQARAHPLRAGELLKSMLDSLTAAEAADPGYDKAGPPRVKALVLLRAPSWPLGPGDVDTGLVEARRAVQLRPEHPPNQLVLAEALSKSGDATDAREAYQRAHDLAQALPTSSDRDDWLKQANQGLR